MLTLTELQVRFNPTLDEEEHRNTVFFHYPCNDGFASATVAWMSMNPVETLFCPINYNDPLELDFVKNKKVYILDFSFPKQVFDVIKANAAKVIMLDHHEKSCIEYTGKYEDFYEAKENYILEFRTDQSGALMTWEYFKAEPAPFLITRISDRDLWNFKYPESKEIHALLQTVEQTFSVWHSLMLALEEKQHRLNAISAGELLLKQFQNNIKTHLGKYDIRTDIHGISFAIVNCSPIFSSDLGNLILIQEPTIKYVLIYNVDESKGIVNVSLRSRKGEFNVNELAQKFSGGGHQPAAGYQCTIEEFF